VTLTVENLEMSGDAVSAEIRAGELSQPLSFRVEGGSFGRELDFLVPLTLLPAMKKGVPISLPGELSPKLLTASEDIQAIFGLWNPSYEPVAVDARRRAPDGTRASGVGCFFSAGVDSFYTAVKHQDEITHLIYLRTGFDRTEPAADENLRAAAEELGKPLIELETNVRPIANAFAVEFADYSSAPLAAAALLFQNTFGKVFIASSFSYLALTRWGSHPLIDPLWSTESLEFVHDGCEATRPMKLAMLADNDVAMRRLRVCHRTGVDRDGAATVNCGECPKCIRTMINLRAAGAAGRCATLPETLDLRDVERLEIQDDRDLAFMLENLHAVEVERSDEELATALRSVLERQGAGTAADVEMPDSLLLRRRLHHAERTVRKRERELQRLRSSLSWRLTAPLRIGGRREPRD
jgi:hypothetical protein